MGKVFCIGFHKTGTKTLKHALTHLGYRVSGPNLELVDGLSKDNYSATFNLVHNFDAFQDNPWPLLFQTLDKNFPDSKFILTLRDEEKWIKSVVNYFEYRNTNMRQWIYGIGYPKGNEEIYLNRFRKHNADVLEYFGKRPQDLLVIDVTLGDGWEKLCPFLNKEIPSAPFPYVNKATYSKFRKWRRKTWQRINHRIAKL